MTVAITGIGTAVPPFGVEQSDAAERAAVWSQATPRQAAVLRRLYARTGVHHRGCCLADRPGDELRWFEGRQTPNGPTTGARMGMFERHAPPLAAEAGRRALAASSVTPEDVTHLVLVTCTGFSAPIVERSIVRRLALPANVHRVHVGFMGCHGALNGLSVARALAAATPGSKVLVIAFELCSLHLQYGWHPERIVPNALFADGAAAAVVTEGGRGLVLEHAASWIVPDTSDAMTWTIGDHGFEMQLSPRVPGLLARIIRPWLDDRLAEGGMTVDGVGQWAIHAGGPRIVEAVAARLALKDNHVADARAVLSAHGNMSSATLLFILERMWGRPGTWVALGFGPGLAVEMTQLAWTSAPISAGYGSHGGIRSRSIQRKIGSASPIQSRSR